MSEERMDNDDDGRGGPAIHIPEQGLHMRPTGRTWGGDTVHHGTLDTSMGVVTVETMSGESGQRARAWSRHAPELETMEKAEGPEIVISVPDQRVAIAFDGEHETGTIQTSSGPVEFRDRR